MKSLVVYYSFEGNTQFIAENIAEAVGADILALKPKEEMKSKGFMKYLWGGKKVLMKERPELLPFDKDPKEYDVLFIGTPVWGWNYTPALNSFFSNTSPKDKKVALFCCHGGGKGGIFKKMRQALEGNEILGTIDFKEPLRDDREKIAERVKEWAKEMVLGL